MNKLIRITLAVLLATGVAVDSATAGWLFGRCWRPACPPASCQPMPPCEPACCPAPCETVVGESSCDTCGSSDCSSSDCGGCEAVVTESGCGDCGGDCGDTVETSGCDGCGSVVHEGVIEHAAPVDSYKPAPTLAPEMPAEGSGSREGSGAREAEGSASRGAEGSASRGAEGSASRDAEGSAARGVAPTVAEEPAELPAPVVETPAQPLPPSEDPGDLFDDFNTDPAPAEAAPADDLFGDPAPAEPPAEAPAEEPAADDLFGDADPEPAADDLFGDSDPEPAVDDLFGGDADPADEPEAPAEEPAEEPAEDEGLGGFDDLFGGEEEEPAGDAPAEEPAGEEEDDAFEDLFGVLGAPGGLESDQLRTWTDNTGHFSCQARLLVVMPKQVRLLKANGRTSTVPLDRLSAGDLEFVNVQASADRVQKASQTAQR